MKFCTVIVILFLCALCFLENKPVDELPNSGLWTNYKYPLYLRAARSARSVQNQIYVTSVEFRRGDSWVWVQLRLRSWQRFQPVYLGNRRWLLKNDLLDISIPLAMTPKGNMIFVAYDMFLPVDGESVEDIAVDFYMDDYRIGKKPVKFLKNRAVINLDSFVEYRPVLDYSAEPGEGDRIWLKSQSGNWKKFGLTVSDSDLLEIYRLKSDKLGKKIYSLTRELKMPEMRCGF